METLLAPLVRFARAACELWPLLAPVLVVGCVSQGEMATATATEDAVMAVYGAPGPHEDLSGEHFFDQPWPSDLRCDNGSPRISGYPNPTGSTVLQLYLDTMKGVLDGFSPAAAGYLRFTGPIDAASLPETPLAALDAGAAVQLIDTDEASPDRGLRQRVSLQWRPSAGVYYRENTLAFMPTIGFPLRPHTRYALVVTDATKATTGDHLGQSPVVAELVGVSKADRSLDAPRAALGPAVDEIERSGVPRPRIVSLAVFTTSDPTRELISVRDGVAKTIAAPTAAADRWSLGTSTQAFEEYRGQYGPSPNYQAGVIPFSQASDGGEFVFKDGLPVLQSTFDPRFSLTVPSRGRCPMPTAGYPVVLYAHGTGGDYRSYVRDGTAQALAEHCLAAMGVDQIFHGTRPGAPASGSEADESLLFFNFQNPAAARTNGRQSAIDEVQRARLFRETHLVVPAQVSITKTEIRFDPAKILFFGHSQGGLNGPLFTAIDDTARGAVFSGSGAELAITLISKTSPPPSVADLVSSLLLGLGGDDALEVDPFHPAIALLQSIADVVDPLHYARLQTIEPRPSFAPKSVYMTEGINPDGTGDSYAPPHGIEAHALAMGLPLQLPNQHPIVEAAWGGPPAVTVPTTGLQGNLGGGRASGVLSQWAVPPGTDGHFVVFRVPQAREQAARFLQNLAADPEGRVPPPSP